MTCYTSVVQQHIPPSRRAKPSRGLLSERNAIPQPEQCTTALCSYDTQPVAECHSGSTQPLVTACDCLFNHTDTQIWSMVTQVPGSLTNMTVCEESGAGSAVCLRPLGLAALGMRQPLHCQPAWLVTLYAAHTCPTTNYANMDYMRPRRHLTPLQCNPHTMLLLHPVLWATRRLTARGRWQLWPTQSTAMPCNTHTLHTLCGIKPPCRLANVHTPTLSLLPEAKFPAHTQHFCHKDGLYTHRHCSWCVNKRCQGLSDYATHAKCTRCLERG